MVQKNTYLIPIFLITVASSSFWNFFGYAEGEEGKKRGQIGYSGPKSLDFKISPDFLFSQQTNAHYEEALKTLSGFSDEDPCWEDAKAFVIQHCGKTGHESRSKIAIKLTNCHLKLSGLGKFGCEEGLDVETCRKELGQEDRSYNTFNNFFIHIDNICNFMKADQFRQTSLESVKTLYESAQNTGKYLNRISFHTKKIQENLEVKQNKLLENQEAILMNNKNLETSLFMFYEDNEKHYEDMNDKQSELLENQGKIKQMAEESGLVLEQVQLDQTLVSDALGQVQSLSTDIFDSVETNSKLINKNLKTIEYSTTNIHDELTSAHRDLKRLKEEQFENFSEMQKGIETFKVDLFDVLDILHVDIQKIKELNVHILSELFYVHGIIFYCLSFSLFWVLTSGRRSSSARVPIYILFMSSLIIESNFYFQNSTSLRKLIFFLGFCILCFKTYYYRDLVIENNILLKKLLDEQKQKNYVTFPKKPLCNINFKRTGFSRSFLQNHFQLQNKRS